MGRMEINRLGNSCSVRCAIASKRDLDRSSESRNGMVIRLLMNRAHK